jgi:integrase
MGHNKTKKGQVSISNYKGRIRLRWRYEGKRFSLSLNAFNSQNLLYSRKIALQIELDILSNQFDHSLVKYGAKSTVKIDEHDTALSTVQYFEKWVKEFKQLDCERNSDYNHLRNTLRKWGELQPNDLVSKLNAEPYSPKTYNSRLTMLRRFSLWMVKQSIWSSNPFEEVSRRKVKKTEKPNRKPFTDQEISSILAAFRENSFCSPTARYKHSHYYPFIYFIFKTGVRNAEAVGLRVSSLDFNHNIIHIKESLARSIKGTNASARVRKETKNGKVRMLPFTDDLKEILMPLVEGRDGDDLVFTSFTGLSIDDRMFQKRVFAVVLKGLNIPHRVLYACRHTFGSRCIDAGMTPVMVSFLMGNAPETLLRSYTHQLRLPESLPPI